MGIVIENIFNFIIYSFIGWIIENIYCYCTEGRFQNDGFLDGPYKPMYGIAVSLLVVFAEAFDTKMIMLILCMLIPTLVEYCSGYILNRGFNKIYWDYSNFKFNLHGYICLQFSLYWMILSFIGVYYIHPLIDNIFWRYDTLFVFIIPIIAIWFFLDLFFTVSRIDRRTFFNTVLRRAKT